MANTLGKEHGKLDLSVYSTGRWVECAVDKCYDRNTLIIHRGTLGYKPLFICEDCIGDMVEEYVRFAGKERAKKVLAAALDLLKDDVKDEEIPAVQADDGGEDVQTAAKTTRKRATAKGDV